MIKEFISILKIDNRNFFSLNLSSFEFFITTEVKNFFKPNSTLRKTEDVLCLAKISIKTGNDTASL